MAEYHKIQTLFKRDMSKHGRVVIGDFALPEFEYLKDNQWVFTEKVDGTNIRVMWDGESVQFGGKTDNAQIPVFLLRRLQDMFAGTTRRQLFAEVFSDKRTGQPMTNVCLYGEGYGAKIQKVGGKYIADGVDFVLFDVKVGDWWLQRADVEDIASKLGIRVVPIIGEGTVADAVALTQQGFRSHWGDFLAEGIVMRPKTELKTRAGERIITKIKHKDFV